MSTTNATSIHRKLALGAFATAGVLLLVSFVALLVALRQTELTDPHWQAVTWQVCQMLAIVAFAFGMWQSQKHKRWKRDNGLEEDNPWD